MTSAEEQHAALARFDDPGTPLGAIVVYDEPEPQAVELDLVARRGERMRDPPPCFYGSPASGVCVLATGLATAGLEDALAGNRAGVVIVNEAVRPFRELSSQVGVVVLARKPARCYGMDGLPAPTRHAGRIQALALLTSHPGIPIQAIAEAMEVPPRYAFQLVRYLQATGAIVWRSGWQAMHTSADQDRTR
jgi:hypothetical protein